jgi:hypothetical protein
MATAFIAASASKEESSSAAGGRWIYRQTQSDIRVAKAFPSAAPQLFKQQTAAAAAAAAASNPQQSGAHASAAFRHSLVPQRGSTAQARHSDAKLRCPCCRKRYAPQQFEPAGWVQLRTRPTHSLSTHPMQQFFSAGLYQQPTCHRRARKKRTKTPQLSCHLYINH